MCNCLQYLYLRICFESYQAQWRMCLGLLEAYRLLRCWRLFETKIEETSLSVQIILKYDGIVVEVCAHVYENKANICKSFSRKIMRFCGATGHWQNRWNHLLLCIFELPMKMLKHCLPSRMTSFGHYAIYWQCFQQQLGGVCWYVPSSYQKR